MATVTPKNIEVEENNEDAQQPRAPKWERREDIKPMVSELIEKFQEQLSHIKPSRIGYMGFSKKKSKNQAKIYGVKPMFGEFMQLDYILTVHVENWAILTVSEKYLLVFHELLHVPAGGFDENSKEFRKCIDHDVKDFVFLVEKFGVHWEESAKILDDMKSPEVKTEVKKND
ncbi:MAG: putative metallopeptidase [Nitrosarchaeum sp.]|nr:putative metallopeptidase [Nitrosarchaeum sp.]